MLRETRSTTAVEGSLAPAPPPARQGISTGRSSFPIVRALLQPSLVVNVAGTPVVPLRRSIHVHESTSRSPGQQHRLHSARGPKIRAPRRIQPPRPHPEPRRIRRPLQGIDRRSRQVLDPHRQRAALVQEMGQGPRVEYSPGRNGSSAARSISPTTASTATSSPPAKTKPPSSGKASPEKSAPSPTSSSIAKFRSFPMS